MIKENVLSSSKLWRQVVNEVKADYPDVEVNHLLVDACSMHLITHPTQFDVIVTENLFGDILSDEASVIPGSLGLSLPQVLGNKGHDYMSLFMARHLISLTKIKLIHLVWCYLWHFV